MWLQTSPPHIVTYKTVKTLQYAVVLIAILRTLALSSCSCAWRSASRRYASRSSSADRSESDGLLVQESADPCQERVAGVHIICNLYFLTLRSCRHAKITEAHYYEVRHLLFLFMLSSVFLFCRLCVQVCMQIRVCIHEHTHVSTTQCAALPHQPSSGRPNIAQRRQLLPLLSCLAPIHSIIPHSAAHIHPLLPMFVLQGHLLISKIYAGYHFSL